MFTRLRKVAKKHSFFLFGPRGTGKTTLLKKLFSEENTVRFDLLDSKTEDLFFRDPSQLHKIVTALDDTITHVLIDEVQKIPKLLDEVHRLIEETDKFFILTGSSARKLKRGGANLLAGRAFVYYLYPLSSFEMGDAFDLEEALHFGMLPKSVLLKDNEEKAEFLRAYTQAYLKEEIVDEQVVRKLAPFRKFLEVCGQCNGKILNFLKISRDVGVDPKTISSYFTILEDTLLGFFLEPYHNSFRKRFVEKPKFYLFDTGVVRALNRRLETPLTPKTTAYGEAFEHFIITECIKLASYLQPDWQFSFLQTASGVEIDLVVERPGKPLLCIEIKSTESIDDVDIGSFIQLTKSIPDSEAIVLSRDSYLKKCAHVLCYPWKQGLEKVFFQT